jgi:hypothetical protein
VEGDYAGIFKPGIHYIEIKKDWSNLPEVMDRIRDVELCENIAENVFRDIVLSGCYTYRNFVKFVIDHVREVHPCETFQPDPSEKIRLLILKARDAYPLIFSPLNFIMYRTKLYSSSREKLYVLLRRYDLERAYQDIRQKHLGISGKFIAELVKKIFRRGPSPL